jgi:hypothetical protein
VLTFVHLSGPLLYGLGWLVIPRATGTPSLVERALGEALASLRRWRGEEPTPPASLTGGRPAC